MTDVEMADAGGAGAPVADSPATKSIGIIQPPPDMKSIVDKTAAFVAKNGPQFEARIMNNERNTTKFAFLQPSSPYFPYYQKKLTENRAGIAVPAASAAPAAPAAAAADEAPASAAAPEGKKDGSGATIESKADVKKSARSRALKEPEPDVYTVKPPLGLSIPSLDLDIIRLTAQYVALNGRSFLNGLLTRENRNPQFDFLKGHHYLFGYFTALVEAYSKVINPPATVDGQLKKDAKNQVDILERAFSRLEWEAHVEKEQQMKANQEKEERDTVLMIDWHDFKVVETIDFPEDEEEDLPPPLSEMELKALRLRANTAKQEAEEAEAAKQAVAAAAASIAGGTREADNGEMDMDEDEAPAGEEVPPPEPEAPMNVVKNYAGPGSIQDAAKSAATKYMISPITGQQVPVEQMSEHMRIALLDPKWKEKSGHVKPGEKEDTLAQHDEVSKNLGKMANKRKDIFGTDEEVFGEPKKAKKPEAGAASSGGAARSGEQARSHGQQVQQQAQQFQPPQVAPPAPPAVAPPAPPPGVNVTQRDAQEKSLSSILARAEAKVVAAVPPPPGSLPPPPAASGGAAPAPGVDQSYRVAPNPMLTGSGFPGGMMPPPPSMLPPPPGAPPAMPPPGAPPMMPPPPSMLPPAPGAPAVPPPGQPPAAAPTPAAVPAAEPEPEVQKGPLSADEWAQKHPEPIAVNVTAPTCEEGDANSKFFTGQKIELQGVSITSTVKELKQLLVSHLNGLVMSKQKLTHADHGVLKDNLSLAHYNFSSGEGLTVDTKVRGGRK